MQMMLCCVMMIDECCAFCLVVHLVAYGLQVYEYTVTRGHRVDITGLGALLEMDCDSDDGELMPKVFAVDDDGDDVDLSVPPTSGQEYLRRVM